MIDSKIIQKIPINNKEEGQENRNTIIKTQITRDPSLELTNYYDYENPDEKERDINELIIDMSLYGEITKNEILIEIEENPNKLYQ